MVDQVMSSNPIHKAFGIDMPEHKRAQIKAEEAGDVLQVIGAGLPRSGTTSLKAALEILGFDPCHHMTVTRLCTALKGERHLCKAEMQRPPGVH